MRIGVVVFPGSNCDHDAWYAVQYNLQHQADFIWHESGSVGPVDAVILPKFSPVMAAVKKFANEGGPVLGICNGFQVLTEAGLLPGALVRNAELKFVCRTVPVEVVTTDSPFTHEAKRGQILQLPVAHGEGCYVADEGTLDQLEAEDRVALRYRGHLNGSMRDIAGILNRGRNVMGMMPHPERAADHLMGSTDGLVVLQSLLNSLVTHS
jgi:phosphoribosylformylglycinamidine synthase I